MGSVQIKSGQIVDNAIIAAKLAANAVATAKIADDAITAAKLADSAVLTAALNDAAVTAQKLGSAAVESAKLADDAVTSAKIATGAVDATALGALAVTSAKINDLAVTAGKLASNAVETAKINNGAVTADKLAANAVSAAKMDLTGTYDFSSGTLRVVATPTNANDASSKQYVDSVAQGSHWKKAAKCAPDSNIDISDLPASIDSQSLSTDDRFLLKSQSSADENGVYLFKGSGNAAVRADDMDVASEFPGAAVYILAGTNAQKSFVCTNSSDPTLGSTDITWTQFSGAGADSITVSGGLSRTGNDISISAGGVSTAKIADLGVSTAKIADAAVSSTKLADNAVTSQKMADDSVGANELIDASVGSAALASNAVLEAKIADNAVATAKIADAAVTAGKLASNSVESVKIADNAVATAKIADNAITSAKIADNAVQTAKIQDSAVTADKLASASVSSAKIASGAVGTSALAATSVSSAKLADSAVTAGKLGIQFKQEGFQISGSSTTTIDLSVALPSQAVNSVLVFKNGLSVRNMTALGDTPADNDEFSVSASGGSSGVCRLTWGAALTDSDSLIVWFFH